MQFFNPFDELLFDDTFCFLTGEEENLTTIDVFPYWFLELSKTTEKRLKMMDKGVEIPYKDLKLPCSLKVQTSFMDLDNKVKEAFLKGYDGLKSLNDHELFLWIGKIVYGVLYFEFHFERKMNEKQGDIFGISEPLMEKLSLFHLMLQSLVTPIQFTGVKPWSITIVKNKYSEDIVNYRDDAVNLMFSVSTNGFGLIACLQDNGVVAGMHRSIIEKIGTSVLHPVQFEELWSKFIYTNYLLQYPASYKFGKNEKGLIIHGVPIEATGNEPLFHHWDDQTFSTVLGNYWKPWGIKEKEIYVEPHSPLSFLENERTGEFIDPEGIKLPY